MKFACRRLAAAPLFTLFSIATLAVGIGATTAVYSFLRVFLWHNSAVPDPDRFVVISQGAAYVDEFSLGEFRDLTAQQTSFSGVAAWNNFSTGLSGNGVAALVYGESVSGEYFAIVGLRATIGRTLQPADDRPEAPAVVVLSDTIWREQFGADPAIVGTTARMAGRSYEVVGVMPAAAGRWRPRGRPVDVWVSLAAAPVAGLAVPREVKSRYDYRVLGVIARLADGRPLAAANAELAIIAGRLDAISRLDTRLNQNRRVWAEPALRPRTQSITETEISRIIVALPALVLLIACTNIANLVLSRGVSRRHEVAVRRAMGASRWRLIREQLVEGGLVATAGALVGVLIAQALITFIRTAIQESFGDWAELRFDARLEPGVLVAVGVAATLALVVSSLMPAVQLTKSRTVRAALASDTPAGATPRWRGRSNLIALQVAASVGLFLIAALFVRGIIALQDEESRIELDRVVLASVPFAEQTGDEMATRARIDRVVDAVRKTPGVSAVALTSLIGGTGVRSLLNVGGTSIDKPFAADDDSTTMSAVATPRLFEMLGRTFRFGRPFDDRDDAAAEPVVIVDESLARHATGAVDAVGRHIVMHRRIDRAGIFLRAPVVDRLTIVGVVTDVPDNRGRDNDVLFLPFSQQFEGDLSILARGTSSDLKPLVGAIRTAIRSAEPDLAIGYAGRADVAMRLGPAVVLGLLTTGALSLATIALVLSMAGLYGVLSHVVTRRTREMGLRMALGAGSRAIIWLVLRDGFRPVVEGACIGLASAAIIRLWMKQYFSRVTVTAIDPLAIAMGIGPLLIAAAIACYLPARRASKVDPNVALREL